MRDWINGACDKVDQLTAQQPYYQELNAKRKQLEKRYLEIVSSLSDADAEIIAAYAYLTSEMEYQRTQTAFQVGRSAKGFR